MYQYVSANYFASLYKYEIETIERELEYLEHDLERALKEQQEFYNNLRESDSDNWTKSPHLIVRGFCLIYFLSKRLFPCTVQKHSLLPCHTGFSEMFAQDILSE